MQNDQPSIESNPRRFKFSDLVDRDRYFYFTTGGLIGLIIILVIILLVSKGTPPSQPAEPNPFAPTNTPQASSTPDDSTSTVMETSPTQTATDSFQSSVSQILLSSDDLNAILDIWSEETTDIEIDPQIGYNLSEAAGRTFVSRSKDIQVTLEIYRFSGDRAMALKVAKVLKQIYLEELGYTETELACPSNRSGYTWIIEEEANHRLYLGSVAGNYLLSIQIFSEVAIEKTNATELICSFAERQLEALLAAGFLSEGEETD